MARDPAARSSPPPAGAAQSSPDPAATGSEAPVPSGGGDAPDHHVRGRETQEREAAWRRGREHHGPDDEHRAADPALTQLAFAALAENVRDYAIFLMDPDGIIRFWGEGARLMKRWTRREAEGGHLRMLYPDGGADDGTAEDHLRDAAAHGESVSDGRRVRGDGTTFWAHITLTALRGDDGALLGFAKVTRDLSAQRAADEARDVARQASELEAARAERTGLVAEVAVLQEELAVLRDELRAGDQAPAPRGRPDEGGARGSPAPPSGSRRTSS
jgi:PAS domain S-box-containing protein